MVQHGFSMTNNVAIVIIQEHIDHIDANVKCTSRNDFIPHAIKTYAIKTFLTSCAMANIAHHEWSSSIPMMFISYIYGKHVSITLLHVQAITILQHVATLGKHSWVKAH